jgi:phytoene desaturase
LKSEESSNKTVIIIGAGFGGIAAALRLKKKGYKVLLLDKQDKPGGRGYSYERSGFTFDAGPTVITAPFLIDEIFALFGKKSSDYLKLVPVDPWYRIRFDDGSTFRYGGTIAQTCAEIEKISPSDVEGYRKLIKKCEKIFGVGFLELGDKPFFNAFSMVEVAAKMIALESYLTVYQLVSKYIKNDKLRQVFTFHPLLVGGNPFNTTSIYALIHYLEREYGVWYAMGGTKAIVEGFTKLMEEESVQIRLNTSVTKILVRDGKAIGVQTSQSETIHADIIVANADPPFVYKHLIDKTDRPKWTDTRIESLDYSMGLFVIYFGTNKTYPELDHHTIMLGPRYKELLEDIFNRKILPTDFSLYLHAPTRTDPSMAPPGHECFYVLAPVPNLQGDINWAVEGDRFADRILDHLEKTILPDLKANLVEKFFVTPMHFRDNLNTHHGTGFSIQPTLLQSAYFRFHNQSEDIDNLYFVGAGTHPGAGLPGVLTSAKVLDRVIPAVLDQSKPLMSNTNHH